MENVVRSDLVIVIVGGRVGADYYKDIKISITQAEFNLADEKGIPVMVFINKKVHDERHLYKNNKDYEPEFTKDLRVFDFIKEINHSFRGHWIEYFSETTSIQARLNSLTEFWGGPRTIASPSEWEFEKIRRKKKRIDSESLSSIAQHFICIHLGFSKELSEADLLDCLLHLPESTTEVEWDASYY